MQIVEEIEEFLSELPIGYVFPTSWFKVGRLGIPAQQ